MSTCRYNDDLRCEVCGHVTHVRGLVRECDEVWIERDDGQAATAHTQSLATHGPGTELKKLLAKIGITATPDCSCNARARLMDERGIEWCEVNLDEIVGWLREEAGKRSLPFLDVAGRVLVRRAIANARRAIESGTA